MDQHLFETNVIVKLSFEFATLIVEYCDKLMEDKKFILSNQLFKSGTSIGANIIEAQNSESKNDFLHKMKIAAKEADECQYWLQLCCSSKNFPDPGELLTKLNVIQKVLTRIISTAKKNLNR